MYVSPALIPKQTAFCPQRVISCLVWQSQQATIKGFYSPTNAQVIVLKSSIKIYNKIAPTCFGAVTDVP